MKKRIICDTCSAIKLAQFGAEFFSINFGSGKIVLHPTLFAEMGKWPKDKKIKYANQIKVLTEVRAEPGLRVDGKAFATQEIIIKATRDALGLSVGKADIDQLISVLAHDLDLITNDAPFMKLAENFEVNVFEAEEIILEAFQKKAIDRKQLESAIETWQSNDEKRPSKSIVKKFAELNFKF